MPKNVKSPDGGGQAALWAPTRSFSLAHGPVANETQRPKMLCGKGLWAKAAGVWMEFH